ncbi:cation:proton antiporter [Streptomyces sp. H39-C1]|uniref:cation:proton antiporter n=1 Tax=Streptomyces sp. H39-C1 TaxID=3004355 RepID=UPI0022B04295|nr:cation:proton antiporter [Streptomyces sp. H39-C1]MCZ4097855.1 cation:proton antiporter [Streptomyces sp. H39-C1]
MTGSQAATLFLGIAVILLLARLLGAGAKAIGQPPVLGEILGGILLGPTLFNGAVARHLFPASVGPFLSALANLGLILFMFVIGFELEHSLVRGRGRIAAAVSLSSILLPFGLGVVLALHLSHRHPAHSTAGFVLFFGAAMSVTAFPVLARILTDRGMQRTPVGSLALACAAVDDLLAWSLLAVVTTIASGTGQWHTLLAPVYLALMIGVVRPLFRRLFATHSTSGRLSPQVLTPVLIGLMLSCWATEWMGVHFIFGAFVFGLVMPRGGPQVVREGLLNSFENVGMVFLLPVFFVTAGLKVDLSHLSTRDLGELGLILLVAISGKFIGAFTGAKLQGVSTRHSGVLATLMNTRGLTELVILTVGVQLGVLDKGLYSLMVVMAMVTTFMAGPILRLIYPTEQIERDTLPASLVVVEPNLESEREAERVAHSA